MTSPAIARRAERLGMVSSVVFMGPRPIRLLPSLLQQADVLVSPRLKGLNTPMKIYSYLDSGSAVLATRLRTHTQVLDDSVAYLVEPEPARPRPGLAALFGDPELRSRLATSAKAYVQREHTPQAARRKLDAFYTTMESRVAAAPGVRRLWRSTTLRSAVVLRGLRRRLRGREPDPGPCAAQPRNTRVLTLVVALVNLGLRPWRRPAWTGW